MAKPKTLTQQYNSLRRKAEKALALPENAGLGLKLPKRPKKITRKSVARMENFNASVKQKNLLRSLRRQERRKISRQNYWQRLRQDPQKYEEVKRRRSEGMKRYWEDLKRNKPEEYSERLSKMQRGAAEYRRKVKSGEIEKKTARIELEESSRTTKQREAQKKYWDELKQNDPEKYRERIEKLQEGRRKAAQKITEETIKEIAEEVIPQIETPEVIPPKSPQDMTDEELTEFMHELSKTSPSPEAQKEIEKEFEEWIDSMQSSSIEPVSDSETPTVTGFKEGQPIEFTEDFELGSFESVLIDQIYEQNFADIMNGIDVVDRLGSSSKSQMFRQFVNRLSAEFESKDEVRYFVAQSIADGDLELNRRIFEDSKLNAKDVADRLLVALDRWMTKDYNTFERVFSFNKNEFTDIINDIANELDEGRGDWFIDEMYPYASI